MQSIHRTALFGIASLAFLAGCNMNSPWGSSSSGQDYGVGATSGSGTGGSGSSGGTGSGTAPGVGKEGTIGGSDDTVIATPSVAQAVVTVGAHQTISIAFTSSDGRATTGFAISGSLGTLPAGWSGPASFSCAGVAAGSDCVLNLTYSPTAVDSGTVMLNYVYVDNSNIPRAPGGSVTIPFQAILPNNVVAAVSVSGQINAVPGAGSEAVSVNFTTDDGNAATNLSVTSNLAALPAGWSSSAASLACPIVSTGSGCQLPLTYAPTAAGRGTFTLQYAYTDDTGAARTGAVNIPYATVAANHVVASTAPTGQITAIEKTGGQAVAVTFTTDDGKAAGNLKLDAAASVLPAGWSGTTSGFACASVSAGNGCQLHLKYAPSALGSGTFTLTYSYDDDSGAARIGSTNVAYAATTNDNAVAAASPAGQIYTVVGMPGEPVAVSFTTDDAREATALQVTTNLGALPAGWASSSPSFACAGFSVGTACQLDLTYQPLAAGTGTLTLRYSYRNNAGEAKNGSLNIPYRATTNDIIVVHAVREPAQRSVGIDHAAHRHLHHG